MRKKRYNKKMAKKLILIIVIISFVILSAIVILSNREKSPSLTKNISDNISEVPEETGDTAVKSAERKETEKSVEQNKTDWQRVNEQKKLYESSSAETNLILKELRERFANQDERLKALAILRLGTPYQLGCLGEESGRDEDPIFRLDVTDCTAFVLTTAALLHSQNLAEARKIMKFLNYRPDSEVTFENRLHFTTDRNAVSPYFEDVTARFLCGCNLKQVQVTLNKIKPDGQRLIDIDWEKETTIKYISNQYITEELFSRLPKALGVAFIKEGDEKIGLDVRHEGILIDGEFLFHATPVQNKVVAEDFFEYYFGKSQSPRFDGIILFKIK